MKKRTVKTAIFGIIYLCIQVPLAILGINGVRFRDIFFSDHSNETVVLDYTIKEGKQELYDCTTGVGFGFVELRFVNTNDDTRISVDYKADPIAGRLEILNKDYAFESFAVNNLVLERNEYRGERYWMGAPEGVHMVIIEISNTPYNKPVPSSIYRAECHYYLCSIVSEFTYRYIGEQRSPVPISKMLFNNIDESYSSGIFYY